MAGTGRSGCQPDERHRKANTKTTPVCRARATGNATARNSRRAPITNANMRDWGSHIGYPTPSFNLSVQCVHVLEGAAGIRPAGALTDVANMSVRAQAGLAPRPP